MVETPAPVGVLINNTLKMNKKDYSYVKAQIQLAEKNKNFYEGLGIEYIKDIQFWKGYLNAMNLIWLQAKNNYKFLD